MRRLIINADDYGLTPGVSAGIRQAHLGGVVTSTTAMANLPGLESDLRELSECPGLGVGLHLVLTRGPAVLPPEEVPSLLGPNGLLRKSLSHLARVKEDEVKREWLAQLKRFTLQRGRPTHLDSHHNVHLLPNLVDVFVDVARAAGCGRVRLISPADLGWAAGPATPVYRLYARHAQRKFTAAGLSGPSRTFGWLPSGQELSLALVEGWLRRLGDGVSELVCHPGVPDQLLLERSGLREARGRELALLTCGDLKALLARHEVQLVSYAWSE